MKTTRIANLSSLCGAIISATIILLAHLMSIYPAPGVDPSNVRFKLELFMYFAVVLTLAGGAMTFFTASSKLRKVVISLLSFVVVAIGILSSFSPSAETLRARMALSGAQSKYQFTADFMSSRIPTWEKLLNDLKGRPDTHALEIGTFEGRSAFWFLENILTHPTSSITCVDTFEGEFEKRFDNNVSAYGQPHKVIKIKGRSDVVLRRLKFPGFDFIYIDGSHLAKDVLIDAILAWDQLKPGGFLIFDDYRWTGLGAYAALYRRPKIAIDAFLDVFAPQVDILHKEYQVIVRKRVQVNLDEETGGLLGAFVISLQRWLG